MKIEVINKNVIFNHGDKKIEIHPIWLRERVREEKYLDKNNDQRLFDPSFLENIDIKKASIIDNKLLLTFSDGVTSKFEINRLISESHSIKLRNLEWGKYGGRIVADLYVDNTDYLVYLKGNPFYILYSGGKKTKNWCN